MTATHSAACESGFTASMLAVRGLACRRGERLLFEGLDIDLAGGGALWLTGPNGAGKTSLLRILAGLLPPDAGAITIGAMAAGRNDAADDLARKTLFLGLKDALKPALRVREALALHTAMLAGRAPSSAALDASIARFGLSSMADLPCGWLSTGQRRRVALARHMLAGVARPLWLMDEPANGLDSHAEALLAGLAAEHRARGGMIVVASHQSLGWPDLAALPMGGAA